MGFLLLIPILLYMLAVASLPVGAAVVVVMAAADAVKRLSRRAGAADAARRRLRATDADRASVIRRLSAECAVGRLTLAELDERAEAAWDARTYVQLERLERDLPAGDARARLRRYRGWLVAAALYNACWGSAVALGAGSVAWKAIGMLVLAYAPGYWWAARDPERRAHFVAVGLLGKLLGPLGFAWAAATGRLPAWFVLVILTNDVLWWPAFAGFLRAAAEAHGGWRRFLAGA